MFKFSVIIATYNRAEYLKECLQSLFEQTFKNFEVLIVDDGSTDNTEDVVKSFSGLLNMKFFKIPNSGYPAKPRNIAAKNASGEWLCFLDSDDKWTKDKLKACTGYADDFDIVFHKLKYFGKGKPWYRITLPSRQVKSPVFVDLMIRGNSIPLSGSMIRKKIFFEVNCFDEDFSLAGIEDYDLWLKASLVTEKFFFVSKMLGYYRMHVANITENSEVQINKINKVYKRYLPRLSLQYHQQAQIIKNYYAAIVYERMGKYNKAIALYKESFKAAIYNQRIKALLRIILIKLRKK